MSLRVLRTGSWGLRDYGTGSWDGGDPGCDHTAVRREHGDEKQATSAGTSRDRIVGEDCRKCGARRIDQQLGLEPTPDEYVARMVDVFREVRRVLRSDGTLWLNLGDSYVSVPGGQSQGANGQMADRAVVNARAQVRDTKAASGALAQRPPSVVGLKPKDLVGIPWRVAFALQADGWWLRSAITWCKPNVMPESVTDRPTKATEMVFLLTKSARYYYDAEAIRTEHQRDGRAVTEVLGRDGSLQHRDGERWPGSGANARDWWLIATQPFSARALGGGDGRITSPDCPVHGDRRRQASTAERDGRADASSHDTSHSDGRPAREPLDDSAPTDPRLEPTTARGSSDSPAPSRSHVATLHSSESRRTDPAPATSPPCTASAQTVDRTDDIPASPESVALFDRTPESSNGQADSDAHPLAETPHRTARKSSCTCKYTDHFATYPEELVRRCILAGTSERGCCPVCGKPWEREWKHGAVTSTGGSTSGARASNMESVSPLGQDPERSAYNTGAFVAREKVTLGWRPGCDHASDPIPCTVLDPFLGSGTTAYVARAHGRRSIGIELNPDYCALAARRMQQQSLFAEAS